VFIPFIATVAIFSTIVIIIFVVITFVIITVGVLVNVITITVIVNDLTTVANISPPSRFASPSSCSLLEKQSGIFSEHEHRA